LTGGTATVDMGAAEFLTVRPPSIQISRPGQNATYALHQQVHTDFRCIEAARGPGILSCRDASGQSSGALLNTSSLGVHHFEVIAKSHDGLTNSKTVTYTVRRHR